MKLSVLPVSYFNDIINGRMTLGDWAREGVKLGLDAIDISIILLEKRNSGYLKSLRQEIESSGIEICGSSTYPDFTHPEESVRRNELYNFKEDLKSLAELGTKVVRVTAGQAHPGVTRSEGMDWAVDSILAAVPTAEANDITLVFENHAKPGVWQYHDFDFQPDIFLEIADRLINSPVMIQFDFANPIAFGAEPLPLLEQVFDRTSVIHASDTKVKGDLVPAIIGTGLVPYKELFNYLREKDYDGWITIEEASGCGAEGISRAVDYIRSEWSSNYESACTN